LLTEGASVMVFDPTVLTTRVGVPRGIALATSEVQACNAADVLVVLTEWDQFKWVSPSDITPLMTGRTVVDARNLLDRNAWNKAGFQHIGIGR